MLNFKGTIEVSTQSPTLRRATETNVSRIKTQLTVHGDTELDVLDNLIRLLTIEAEHIRSRADTITQASVTVRRLAVRQVEEEEDEDEV